MAKLLKKDAYDVTKIPDTPAPAEKQTPFNVAPDEQAWGELVSWSFRGVDLTLKDLADALKAAELDEREARAFLPRNAWLRACRKLSDKRIIRKLDIAGNLARFQFTAEERDADRFEYKFETEVKLILNLS